MNASQFLELIQHADFLEKNEVLQIRKIQSNFPYFQLPHVLAARYEFLKNKGAEVPSLAQAAVTSPNRIWLKSFLDRPISAQTSSSSNLSEEDLLPESDFKVPSIGEQTQKLKKLDAGLKSKSGESVEEISKVPTKKKTKPKEPNEDLLETIKKKEKKEIIDERKKEQIDLIKAFSNKSIKLATLKEIETNPNNENLAAESTKISDKLISESFAKILAVQGKTKMAKEIYQMLISKFPDKRAYFADLIEKLKD